MPQSFLLEVINVPKDFLECVREKGKVRTLVLPGKKYVHICILNGKTYYGEVKVKKEKDK